MKENLAAGFQSKLLSADRPRFQLGWVVSSRTHPARRASGQGGERGWEGEQKQGSSVDLILPFPSFAPNTPCLSLPSCQTGKLNTSDSKLHSTVSQPLLCWGSLPPPARLGASRWGRRCPPVPSERHGEGSVLSSWCPATSPAVQRGDPHPHSPQCCQHRPAGGGSGAGSGRDNAGIRSTGCGEALRLRKGLVWP